MRDSGEESIDILEVQVTHLSFVGTPFMYHLLYELN